MTLSPYDHPVLSAWMGDAATRAAFSWEAESAGLLAFWRALAEATAEAGLAPPDDARALADALRAAALPPPEALADRVRRDGMVVPGLVAALRGALPPGLAPLLHRGATTQDALDTALMLRMRDLARWQADRLGALDEAMAGLADRFGARPLMAVTRMRDALPVTVGDRIATWRGGLAAAAEALRGAAATAPVQLAGPVGDGRGFDGRVEAVRAGLARRLALRDPGGAWHVDRAPVMRVAAALEAAARAGGKVGLDLAMMAQDRVGDAGLRGGGSSAMAHKVNPVDAELAVAAARHAAALLGAQAGAALHEAERSGAAWTAEWMTLPPLAGAAGAAILAVERLVPAVERLGPAG